MHLPLLILLALLSGCTVEDAAANTGPAVFRVYFQDAETLRMLTSTWAPWTVQREEGWVLLELRPEERARLAAQGLRLEEDAEKTAELRPPPRPSAAPAVATRAPPAAVADMPEGSLAEETEDVMVLAEDDAAVLAPGIPGYPCYSTVEEVYARAAALAEAHPDRARWTAIGDSWLRQADAASGYPLMVLTLGTDRPEAADLVVVSGLHPREYAPVQAALRFAEDLLAAEATDPGAAWLLRERQLHLILAANPDGRKLAEQQLLWRKNRRETACSTEEGVDLNRNFPFAWGCCGGSSDDACSQVFRGEAAGSEPEIAAITAYLAAVLGDHRPDDLTTPAPPETPGLFVDLHSYSELVLWSWGGSAQPAPNAEALATLGRKLAGLTGYYPEPMIDLYPTDGTSIDYVYGTLGVAAYTIELGQSFFEPCEAFEQTIYPAVQQSLRYAATVADAPYLTPAGPDLLEPALSANPVARRDPVTLSVTADDTRFSTRNGQEAAQNIRAVALTTDALPGTADPILLLPADGALDSPVEAMTIQLSGRDLGSGMHTLYLRAQDDQGHWGPAAALALQVGDP